MLVCFLFLNRFLNSLYFFLFNLKSDFISDLKLSLKSDFNPKLKSVDYWEILYVKWSGNILINSSSSSSSFSIGSIYIIFWLSKHLFTLISTLSKRQFSKLLTSSFIYLFYFLEMGFLLFFIFFLETFSSSLLIHCSIFLIFFRSYLFNSSLNYYQDYYKKR